MTKRNKAFLILGVVLLLPLGWLIGAYLYKTIHPDDENSDTSGVSSGSSVDDTKVGKTISDGIDNFLNDLGDVIFVDDEVRDESQNTVNDTTNLA